MVGGAKDEYCNVVLIDNFIYFSIPLVTHNNKHHSEMH